MIRTSLTLLVLALIGLTAKDAAADTVWSTVGGGCTVTDEGIQANRYTVSSGGSVAHSATNVDLITLYCPVYFNTATSSNPNGFWLTFRDTSTTTGNNIVATLQRRQRAGSIVSSLATLNTNSFVGSTTQHQGVSFTHTFDFDNYYYLVKVEMDRSATTNFEDFIGTALTFVVPP